MARILFINLKVKKFNNESKEMELMYNPPLGLLYIASTLTLAGHRVKIIDFTKEKYSKRFLFNEIESFNPTIVGFSVYTENIYEAFKICKGIKKNFPEIKTVFGGPHATLEPIHAINDANVDFVIKNEGESTFLELVEAIDSNEKLISLENVMNIAFYSDDNQLVHNKQRKDIKDLDLLPFPIRSDAEIQDYGSVINVITSRGCPANCIYCSATALSGAKYRVRSVEHTLLEIMLIKALFKERLKVIYILDDTFTAIPERVFKFFELKKQFNLDFLWRCESRVDVVTEEMVKGLAESNCIGVAYGVESGSQKILDKIHKKISLKQVEHVLEWMHKYDIYTSLNFMIGHYCDTVDTMEMTYEFIKKVFNQYGVGIFTTFNTPFPGTWQNSHMDEIGLELVVKDYSQYTVLTPSIQGKSFTMDDQLRIYEKIYPIMQENDYGLR